MSTTTIDSVATGETCDACGEELALERFGDGEVELSCGCSCASALC